MSWTLLIWLTAFVLQGGLLGRSMYALVTLTDLEQDFLNPFDVSTRLNRFVVVEYAVQFLLSQLLLWTGMWFSAAFHLCILAYMVRLYLKRQVYMDATEAFKQLKPQKMRRGILFGLYCASFIFVTYRVIETAIHTVLTPEGRETAKKLFREAASSLHGY